MKLYDGRESFYQWDLNQKLTSDTLRVGDEVHYSNLKQTKALITIAYELDGKVVSDVPNILLQNAHPINVDRYIKSGDSECTVEQYSFKVKQKVKPSDYVYTETEIKNWEELFKRIKDIENGGTSSRIGYVTLLSSAWEGDGNLYSQVVTIDGTTKNTQVDLTPSVEQLAIFYNKDLTFVTENENGVVTVYAIGQKPQNDYTIQVTLTEVVR